MKIKIIKSSRLKIVPFSRKYLTERYVSWLNDPETMKYSEQRQKRHTIQSCYEYWKSFEGTPNNFWAIVLINQEKHIGNFTTYKDTYNNVVSTSILIGERTLCGQGYGLEAREAMFSYLFREEKVRKITSGTLSVNKAMIRLMEKSNMIEDGRRKRHCIWRGKEVDIIYAALFREDYIDKL